jgi:hypothetical protein
MRKGDRMAKYLGYIVLNESFVAVYVDPKTGIIKKPVYGFLLTSEENEYSFLPIVYDAESHRIYAEKGGSAHFLGIFPQNVTDDELKNALKEETFSPKSETDVAFERRKKILEIMKDMESKYPDGIPRTELVARCAKELNMEGKEVLVERDVRSLYESGRIWIPKPGYVKLVPRRE